MLWRRDVEASSTGLDTCPCENKQQERREEAQRVLPARPAGAEMREELLGLHLHEHLGQEEDEELEDRRVQQEVAGRARARHPEAPDATQPVADVQRLQEHAAEEEEVGGEDARR